METEVFYTMFDLEIMAEIQAQKEKEIDAGELLPLDDEGKKLAEGKRFTFDVVETPVDPLR